MSTQSGSSSSPPVVIVGAGLAGLTRRAAPGTASMPRRRAGQAQPRRRRDRMGAGRHRRRARRATTASNRTCATRRRPAPGWSTSTPRASSPSTAPQAVEWLVRARRAVLAPIPEGPLGLHLTREGGHACGASRTRPTPPARRSTTRCSNACAAHPNITLRERWMAVDLITSRHLKREEPPRCYGVYALDIDQPAASRRCRPTRSCWPPAAPARSTSTPPTPTPPPATASRWPGAPAAASPTWSSSSSTRPACTTRRSAAS